MMHHKPALAQQATSEALEHCEAALQEVVGDESLESVKHLLHAVYDRAVAESSFLTAGFT
jgi:hypothetical protein